jgi:hypothetical protein
LIDKMAKNPISKAKKDPNAPLFSGASLAILFISLLVSSVVALVALGALYHTSSISLGISGGKAEGSLFSARHYGTFNAGGKGQGDSYSANVGLFRDLFENSSGPQLLYGADLIDVADQTTSINNDVIYTLTIENTGNSLDNYTLSLANLDSAGTASLNQSEMLNLGSGSISTFTLAVGASRAGNYTVLARATSQGDAEVYDEIAIDTEVIDGPLIASEAIYYYAVTNGTNVRLYISSPDASSVWADITKPGSNAERIALANNANATFSNASQPGRYNVTFYANDSYGAITSAEDYFECFTGTDFSFTVLDLNSSGLDSSGELDYRDQAIYSSHSESGDYHLLSPDSLMELRLRVFGDGLQVIFRGFNATLENGKILRVDRHNNISGYLVTYGIENSFSFTNSTVRLSYGGTSYTDEDYLRLFKCEDYDLARRACRGSWTDVSSSQTQDAAGDFIEYLTDSFSGFSIWQGPYCGDRSCNNGETCSSCSADCGQCSSGRRCLANWTCSDWGPCSGGTQARACDSSGTCLDSLSNLPATTQNCTMPLPSEKETAASRNIASAYPAQEIITPLFDISLELLAEKITSNGELLAKITVINLGRAGLANAKLFSAIRDISGKIVYDGQEKIPAEMQNGSLKRYYLSNLEEGDYTLLLDLTYDGQKKPAHAEKAFTITGRNANQLDTGGTPSAAIIYIESGNQSGIGYIPSAGLLYIPAAIALFIAIILLYRILSRIRPISKIENHRRKSPGNLEPGETKIPDSPPIIKTSSR